MEFLRKSGAGNPVEILMEATVLHEGWELDNKVWLCREADGSVAAYTTNHGGECALSKERLDVFIQTTKDSLASLISVRLQLK